MIIADGLRVALRTHAESLMVAAIAQVESYDSNKQTCTARPSIKKRVANEDGTIRHESMPTLVGIPVIFQAAVWNLKRGDTVLLVFLNSDSSALESGGHDKQAITPRSHSIEDCVAIPWSLSFSKHETGIGNGVVRVGNAETTIIELGGSGKIALNDDLNDLRVRVDAIAGGFPSLPYSGADKARG
jgi:hypothetical protein